MEQALRIESPDEGVVILSKKEFQKTQKEMDTLTKKLSEEQELRQVYKRAFQSEIDFQKGSIYSFEEIQEKLGWTQ